MRNTYTSFVGKPEGNRPLGTIRHTRQDNIKTDLREIMFGVRIGFIWLK
jgi:hypothetical protein